MSKYTKPDSIPYKLLLLQQWQERIDAIYNQYTTDQTEAANNRVKSLALESDFKLYLSRLLEDISIAEKRLRQDGYVFLRTISPEYVPSEILSRYEYEFTPIVHDDGSAQKAIHMWARRTNGALFRVEDYVRELEDMQRKAVQS